MAPGTPPGTPPGLGRAKLARQTDMPDKFVLQNGKCRAKTHPACDTAAQTHEFARHPPLLRDNFVAQIKIVAQKRPRVRQPSSINSQCRQVLTSRQNLCCERRTVARATNYPAEAQQSRYRFSAHADLPTFNTPQRCNDFNARKKPKRSANTSKHFFGVDQDMRQTNV